MRKRLFTRYLDMKNHVILSKAKDLYLRFFTRHRRVQNDEAIFLSVILRTCRSRAEGSQL